MLRFRLRSAVAVLAVVAASLVGVGGPQGVGLASVDAQVMLDPGPSGDFSWKGLNWQRRTSAENWGPAYNRRYEAANVSGPDSRGYVTLQVTNPTGGSPVSAEFSTTRGGFGYGTYVTVVEKRLDVMQPELVWGCLFTYDAAAAPGFTEIDVCEASAWGGGVARNEPVVQTHGYWFDATKPPGQGSTASSFVAGSASVHTHRMVWSAQQLVFETYSGHGFGGPQLKRTVLTGSKVPVPTNEKLHFNFWAFGGNGGNPDRVKPETVVVRDFSFTPAEPSAPTRPGKAGATHGDRRSKVSWSPASSTGDPITGYQVTASPGGRQVEVAANAQSATITGLTNGVTYTFQVRALSGGAVGLARSTNVVIPKPPPPPHGFPDVPRTAYFDQPVRWLKAEGITGGYGTTGRFAPDVDVTRAQMAAFIHRVMDAPTGSPAHGFSDVPRGVYYEEAVRWLKANAITNGYGETGFAPHASVSRAQMAAFLWRAAGSPRVSTPHGFPDVPRGAYFDEPVRWLTAHGITTGYGETGRFAPDQPVTRAQMAAFLHRMGQKPAAWSSAPAVPSTIAF